jgi:hypothetical protein
LHGQGALFSPPVIHARGHRRWPHRWSSNPAVASARPYRPISGMSWQPRGRQCHCYAALAIQAARCPPTREAVLARGTMRQTAEPQQPQWPLCGALNSQRPPPPPPPPRRSAARTQNQLPEATAGRADGGGGMRRGPLRSTPRAEAHPLSGASAGACHDGRPSAQPARPLRDLPGHLPAVLRLAPHSRPRHVPSHRRRVTVSWCPPWTQLLKLLCANHSRGRLAPREAPTTHGT